MLFVRLSPQDTLGAIGLIGVKPIVLIKSLVKH